ncbi:MAG: hypothetical protein WCS25_03870 [Victivallaceae bacterium]
MKNLIESIPAPPSRDAWGFVDELSRYPQCRLRRERTIAKSDEADLSGGVMILPEFPDTEHLLDSAYESLRTLLMENELYPGNFPVVTRRCPTDCFEAYVIEITADRCIISGADTEGIRRGIYELEDLLREAEGPFLPCGKIIRAPWLKTRISRCFFSPVKRWPVNTDELLEETNFYPDAYLNRLAYEGINGVWLVAALRELSATSFTGLDSDASKRLVKLRSTVNQCRRFGIKVYLFCIEPFSVYPDDPLLIQHPELFREDSLGERRCFCPSVPETQQFLREMTDYVFKRVNGLGGIINITHGERPTTCLSHVAANSDALTGCPRCDKIPHGAIVRQSLKAMLEGMREHNPEALLISWFYFPHTGKLASWTEGLAAYMPDGVIAQFNFESGGETIQQGRLHRGGDYWLSFAGPSARYAHEAETGLQAGVEVSAKLQVGCGHELGTVPFIPVPGQLYRKFHAMWKLKVKHAMFCWYLGNYPGIMNRAAGRLAFTSFAENEHDFLIRLALPEWGTASPDIVRGWQCFARAYKLLPFSLMYQYYGPQNTGIGWPLSLFPHLRPLAPPWKPDFPVSGDAIGECLAAFDIAEAHALVRQMSRLWKKGMAYFEKYRTEFADNHERQLDYILYEAIGLQLHSSANILQFYIFRNQLFSQGKPMLKKMRAIVDDEIKNTRKMKTLCRKDSRLGFHSEALCHRYYPELLDWRHQQLKQLLKRDFPALESESSPWEYFLRQPDAPKLIAPGISQSFCGGTWSYLVVDDKLQLTIQFAGSTINTYFIDGCGNSFPNCLTWQIMNHEIKVVFDNRRKVTGEVNTLAATSQGKIVNGICLLLFPLSELPISSDMKLRINLKTEQAYAVGKGYPHRLYLYGFSPADTCLLDLSASDGVPFQHQGTG